MEMKPGYKWSEVGIIPQDWEVLSVADLASFTSGKGIKVSALRERSSDFPIPVYGGNGIAGYTTTPLVLEQSVIVGRVGQKCGEVYVTEGPAWVTDNALYPRHIRQPMDIEFLALALQAAHINELKNRNDLPLLTQSILHGLRVAWPPTVHEQKAVSKVLRDLDAEMDAESRLIAKKRDLKQATMQQLLTGQTRLPDFKEQWEVRKLGDLGFTFGGLTGKGKSDFGDGSGQYITFMNVLTNVVIDCGSFERVKILPTETQNCVVKGDLLFNGSSETPEEVAMCAVLTADIPNLFLNSFCFGFRLYEHVEMNGLFLAYYFRSREGRELIKSLAQGSTRYNLSKTALLNSVLRLPSFREQIAIATVLMDMDLELAALEQRLLKTRALKQGMMQELLTGRTRLVAKEATHA